MKFFARTIFVVILFQSCTPSGEQVLLDGFSQWRTGHDEETTQLIPASSNDALTLENNLTVAHAKFVVKGYGEMSFPIDPQTPEGEEARQVDLSESKFIVVSYQANHEAVLQLRQTGVHGGVHNHVSLPESVQFVTDTIYFAEFKGGLKPLNLTDVAKFNFALLSNDSTDGFAEIVVKSFKIDRLIP